MSFRTNLQYLRSQRNMTQEQLAMLLGVSRQAISKWESDKAYPEMDKLLAICDLFGCTLDDLVLGDVSRPASGLANARQSTGASASAEVPANASVTTPAVTPTATPAITASPGKTPAALPRDLTGYDAHRRMFATLIASGVAVIVASVGVANLFDEDNSIIGTNPLNDFLTFLCICVGVIIGLALLIPGSMSHAAFKRAHPYVEDFYTENDRRREMSTLAICVVGGIAAILIGIAVVMYADDVMEISAGWPNAVMLLLCAAGIFGFVYGGMRYGLLDIERYNSETEANHRVRDGEQDPTARLTGAVNGIIMLAVTVIALIVLFLSLAMDWHAGMRFFWIPWPIGGILCAIASVVIAILRDYRGLGNDKR
ncbi:helix-turn-helix transcriptional regulator [Bifidobacterium sp. UTBIF-78]|uniref:helix-turn-helix transcriptional regulator n=1 Tax=Bifidobacterium sp. UTBIF-78 TaxID=1465263 RepID=UPI00112A68EA|nr:helix-turn-helix transcriptional regulator [Bifidobacterium sp. UTBIF-78]TPF94366.1 XRE family transcriptional regulator [Bifidobacterium sp. UTBIF-78]